MLAGLFIATLLATSGARLPSGLQQALQDVADKKALQYNCTVNIALLDSEEVVAVAGSPDHRAQVSDIFAFGSGAKPYTGASILKLVSEGRLGLDDRVAPLVDTIIRKMTDRNPALGFSSVADLWGEEHAAQTTIRDLLTMRSGVPDFDTALGFGTTDPYREFVYADPGRLLTPLELMNASWVRGHWVDLSESPLSYSSTNFMLLGLVLAQAAGADSWEDFDQGSFLPEGLRGHLKFALGGAPRDHGLVQAYDRTEYNMPDGAAKNADVSGVKGVFSGWTASNLIASAPHMAELVWAIYGPEPSIAPLEYAKLMHKPSLFYGVATFNLDTITGQASASKYGIAYGHHGATYGYQSISLFLPGFNWSLVVATNVETQQQMQPSDAACLAYGAATGLVVRRDLNCSWEVRGYALSFCKCDDIEAAKTSLRDSFRGARTPAGARGVAMSPH